MGKETRLRNLIGVIKDKASLSKAALLLANPKSISLQVAVLRATTHSPPAPPDDHQITTLFDLGDSSRATASALVSSLMDRLHRTRDSVVALKCLLVIHHVIRSGCFILQDQLSIFPVTGGRNYLKLSDFRDGATAATWALSAWVRWYARYLETLLSTSRVLGFFLSLSSSKGDEADKRERVSSLLNTELIRDVDSLVGVIEEICKAPDSIQLQRNKLMYEVIQLVGNDYESAIDEAMIRLSESIERLGSLSFAESVELVCCLKKFQDCKQRLLNLFEAKIGCWDRFWVSIEELKVGIGMGREGVKLLTMTMGNRGSESARLGNRLEKSRNSMKRFSSGRFGSDEISFVLVKSVQSS